MGYSFAIRLSSTQIQVTKCIPKPNEIIHPRNQKFTKPKTKQQKKFWELGENKLQRIGRTWRLKSHTKTQRNAFPLREREKINFWRRQRNQKPPNETPMTTRENRENEEEGLEPQHYFIDPSTQRLVYSKDSRAPGNFGQNPKLGF